MHNFAWSDLLSCVKLTGNLFPSPSLRVSNVSWLKLHCTIACRWQTFVIDVLCWWLVCLALDHTVFFGSWLMGHFVQMQYFACLPVETCLVDQLHWSVALLNFNPLMLTFDKPRLTRSFSTFAWTSVKWRRLREASLTFSYQLACKNYLTPVLPHETTFVHHSTL